MTVKELIEQLQTMPPDAAVTAQFKFTETAPSGLEGVSTDSMCWAARVEGYGWVYVTAFEVK